MNTQPIVSIDKTGEPIDITTNQGFDLFFWYNKDTTYDTRVQNAVASISVVGKGLEIDNQRLEDIYFTDASQSALLTCDSSATGKGFAINPDLSKNNVLEYGLQSANKDSKGSQISNLNPGQYGCLRVGFKIVSGAVIGNKAKVIYDSDAKNSPSIPADKKPAKIEMEFLFGNQTSSISQSASSTKSQNVNIEQTQAQQATLFNSQFSQILAIFTSLVLLATVIIWFFYRRKYS
jgi:hypothetical protein